ncbi:MAG: hypothetical protein RLZZ305_1541 [Actinomycetota bacterium]|jgi:Zn ribbon nucleic-acid-binding protein
MSIFGPECELCEAARMTEWFHEDDEMWIAECEACGVPMVVWRTHDPHPPEDVKARLHARLLEIVDVHWDMDVRIDDNMRTIPDHYHAHARPRQGFYGHGMRRAN